jgi:serine/threonine protein kinase
VHILSTSGTRINGGLRKSPEALRGIYGAKTDIWTFGIVMYEVMTQCEPHIDEDTLFVGLKIRCVTKSNDTCQQSILYVPPIYDVILTCTAIGTKVTVLAFQLNVTEPLRI